jgi:hypothetical protein
MEFLRVTKNAWGQETLAGVSWDLIPWFFGAALLFIVLHALWMAVRGARHRNVTREQ